MSVKTVSTFNSLKREHEAHYNPNSKMAYAYKCMESCGLHFSCCWIGLLCSQLFLQPSIWKLEFVENISLLCFLFHHLLADFISNDMESLEKSQVPSSIPIFGFNHHLGVFLFF
jgi:hypothetical protein